MQTADNGKFIELLTGVHDFYGKELSEFAIGVWLQAMQPFEFDAVRDAFNRHCVNTDAGQFMPKPADIVKMLQGSSQDSALRAWAKVDRAVRHIGTYESVAFDDPLIHRVLHEMGGWIALGTKTEDEWPFVAKEFENRYRGYRSRNATPEYPPVLIGIAEAHNSKEGFKTAEPMLIGDHSQAHAVMQRGSSAPMLGMARADALAKPALKLAEAA